MVNFIEELDKNLILNREQIDSIKSKYSSCKEVKMLLDAISDLMLLINSFNMLSLESDTLSLLDLAKIKTFY